MNSLAPIPSTWLPPFFWYFIPWSIKIIILFLFESYTHLNKCILIISIHRYLSLKSPLAPPTTSLIIHYPYRNPSWKPQRFSVLPFLRHLDWMSVSRASVPPLKCLWICPVPPTTILILSLLDLCQGFLMGLPVSRATTFYSTHRSVPGCAFWIANLILSLTQLKSSSGSQPLTAWKFRLPSPAWKDWF